MRYLIIFFSLLLFADEPRVTVEQLFSVKTVKVTKNITSQKYKSFGYVRVDESKRYAVSPRFGGYIEVLYTDALYKYVKKGDTLAKVYSPEVLSAKEEYLSSLKFNKVRKNREMLKSAKEKLLLLNVNQKEIDAISRTGKISRFTDIVAPKSGYIFSKSVTSLDSFKVKQKLFEIVDLQSVWVEMTLLQKDISRVEKMKSFKVNAKGLSESFEAKKGILYPSLEKNEATLTLRLHLQNKNSLLKNGMYVSVNAYTQAKEYLTLPTTAVIRKNGLFYVFIAGEYEGEYEPAQVEVKVLNTDAYIVLSGVEEGDEVVNHALFMMDSDAQINGLY